MRSMVYTRLSLVVVFLLSFLGIASISYADDFIYTVDGVNLDSNVVSANLSSTGWPNESYPLDIRVDGGDMSINSGSFVSSSRSLTSSGATFAIRVHTLGQYHTSYTGHVIVSSSSTTKTYTFVATTLDDPRYVKVRQPLNTAVQFTGIQPFENMTFPILVSVSGGLVKVNDGGFGSTGALNNQNDTLTVRITTGNQYDTDHRATVSAGNTNLSFVARTLSDWRGLNFTLTGKTNANVNSYIVSAPIRVLSGSSYPIPVTVSGGYISLNGGPESSTGLDLVSAQDTVTVSMYTGSGYNTIYTARVTIGSSVAKNFTVRTRRDSRTVATSFTTSTVPSVVSTGAITDIRIRISTGTTLFPVPVIASGATLIVSGSLVESGTLVWVNATDTLSLRLIAPDTYNTRYAATIRVGASSRVFTVRTRNDPLMTPVAFTTSTVPSVVSTGAITDIRIRISTGTTLFPVPVIASGATLIVSGSLVESGTLVWVNATDTLSLRLIAPDTYNTRYAARISVGRSSRTISVRTIARPR